MATVFTAMDDRVARIRRFNRAYTRRIGALGSSHLDSRWSLTDVRVLYEVAHRPDVVAAALSADLGLDAGYLSRVLARLERDGVIVRSASANDGRQRAIALTAAGRAAFDELDARARADVATLMRDLGPDDLRAFDAALTTVERVLGDPPSTPGPVVLRTARTGDYGWIIQRHGELYAREYAWDERFEALVGEIVVDYIGAHDDRREHCWIAESATGARLGSVMLVRVSDDVAKLRLLLVEPAARGQGVGRALVRECVRMARAAGYTTLTLWTNSVLDAARGIYASEGFRLVHSQAEPNFGHDLVAETWELALRDADIDLGGESIR